MSFLLLFYRLKEPMATPRLERTCGPVMGTSRHIRDYPAGPPPQLHCKFQKARPVPGPCFSLRCPSPSIPF